MLEGPTENDPLRSKSYQDYPETVHLHLYKYNLIAGILHLFQAIIQSILAGTVKRFKNFRLPIRAFHLAVFNNGENNEYLDAKAKGLGTIRIAAFIPLFFFLSSLFHFIVISKPFNPLYRSQINNGKNYFRWIEYSISSSLMIWIIAMFFGVYDFAFLLSIAGINAVMNFCGLMMEKYNNVRNKNARVDWLPFAVGVLAGFIPWFTVYFYLSFGPSAKIPDFVWGVLVGYFIFFNTFPLNMILQYKRISIWSDYKNGELGYIILSLGSKTLLGWLVFGGLNQPNKYS